MLATTNSGGSPQVTPVWVDHDGENVLVNTTLGMVKYRNVKSDPRVVLAVVDWVDPYRKMLIWGRLVGAETTGAQEHIDKLARKYLGREKYQSGQPDETRVILRIKPEKVVT